MKTREFRNHLRSVADADTMLPDGIYIKHTEVNEDSKADFYVSMSDRSAFHVTVRRVKPR